MTKANEVGPCLLHCPRKGMLEIQSRLRLQRAGMNIGKVAGIVFMNGFEGFEIMTYAETQCPNRGLNPKTWYPSNHCIEGARQDVVKVRPLPPNFALTDWMAATVALAGITEETLREPWPMPQPPAAPEA